MEDVLKRMEELRDKLPRQQVALCDYIRNNIFEASTLTIPEIAEKANVGTATVTRTIRTLGYTSYLQFKNELKAKAVAQLNISYDKYMTMHLEKVKTSSKKDSVAGLISSFELGLRQLKKPEFAENIQKAILQILNAKRIYLLGLRTSYPYSQQLFFDLENVGLMSVNLSDRPDMLYDRLSELARDDLLIVVAGFPAATQSVEALKLCHAEHVPTLLITSTVNIPEGIYSSVTLNTYTNEPYLSAVMINATIEVLHRELGFCLVDMATSRLKHVIEYKEKYNLNNQIKGKDL